jgi:ABC-type transport system substrate-binding protein
MVDTIQGGLVQIAHSWVPPGAPEYQETLPAAVRYEYDPRRAADILGSIGYTRGVDNLVRDQSGQPLALEARVTATPAIHPRAFFPVVDYWQRLGLTIDPVVIPTQRIPDVEYRTQHPTFELIRFAHGPEAMDRIRASATPLPANNFRGNNRSRYVDPAFDALVDRYFATIPWAERMETLRGVVHQVSDQLIIMGLFYDARANFIGNRVQNVFGANLVWNTHDWDIQ